MSSNPLCRKPGFLYEQKMFNEIVDQYGETSQGLEALIHILQALSVRLGACYGQTEITRMITDAFDLVQDRSSPQPTKEAQILRLPN